MTMRSPVTSRNHPRPNVIWIFADQLRAQALGYRGDPNCCTPNLDRLAAEGLVMTHAVSGSPLCCPFRGSLLTSRYPHECVPGHEAPLPEGQKTIAHAFRDAGYSTAYFGKWHLDGHAERRGRGAMHIIPPHRRGGFEHWLAYHHNPCQWDSWVHGGEGDQAFHYRLEGYETDVLTDRFIDHLQTQAQAGTPVNGRGRPFFSVLSLHAPHSPYLAPPEWMGRHTPGRVRLRPNVPNVPRIVEQARRDLAGYYAMIENLDWNIGRILQALARTGLLENTHVLFFSDHGDMHGSHGQFRKTLPWEESIRIPFIIAGMHPYYFGKRGQCDVPINHVDIAPTTLGLCGIPQPSWMRGTDYSGYRLGTATPQIPLDSAYLQLVAPRGNGQTVDRPWRGIVTHDGWKYVILEGQPWMMFNLHDDPYEQVNLAHDSLYRNQRQKLQDCLTEWIHRVDDRFNLPDIQTVFSAGQVEPDSIPSAR